MELKKLSEDIKSRHNKKISGKGKKKLKMKDLEILVKVKMGYDGYVPYEGWKRLRLVCENLQKYGVDIEDAVEAFVNRFDFIRILYKPLYDKVPDLDWDRPNPRIFCKAMIEEYIVMCLTRTCKDMGLEPIRVLMSKRDNGKYEIVSFEATLKGDFKIYSAESYRNLPKKVKEEVMDRVKAGKCPVVIV